MTAASGYLSVQSQNNSAKSVDVFLKRESSNKAQLFHCGDEYNLTELVFRIFGDIPHISESILLAYVYHLANKQNIPISSSCETLLLPDTKKLIEQKGVTLESLKQELKNHSGDQQLTDLDCVHLLNTKRSLIREFPYK